MSTTIAEPDLTVSEVAAVLNLSVQTIRAQILSGRIPAYRVGDRFLRIRREDLEKVRQGPVYV